jgi:hypothetical protein
MISDEKIRQIRKSVSRGKPEGEINQNLIREGYSQEDIGGVAPIFKGDKMGDDFTYFQLFQVTLAYRGKCDTDLLFSHVYKGKLGYIKAKKASAPSPHTTKKKKRLRIKNVVAFLWGKVFATVGFMRKETGKESLDDIRKAAKKRK